MPDAAVPLSGCLPAYVRHNGFSPCWGWSATVHAARSEDFAFGPIRQDENSGPDYSTREVWVCDSVARECLINGGSDDQGDAR